MVPPSSSALSPTLRPQEPIRASTSCEPPRDRLNGAPADAPPATGQGGLAGIFAEGAAVNPDAPALIHRERSFTFAELDETARRWAALLLDSGRRKPERVGIFAHKSPTAYLGTLPAAFA